ncbi:MAG: diacylglycerol/polyprenol kinase family protein [Candidatus Woesearchaeota archaeon]
MKKFLERDKLLTRKLIHIMYGIFTILFYYFFQREIVLGFNLFIFLFSLILSRYLKKNKVFFFSYLTETFSKENEEPLMGFIYFVVGASLSIYFFEKSIALASITILTFGDSFSSLIGTNGKFKFKISKKNIEGMIAGTIIATFFSQIFIGIIPAFIGSFFGMLAEYIDFKTKFEMDDNILIPLVSGIAINIFRAII